jgi:hypothetical protein
VGGAISPVQRQKCDYRALPGGEKVSPVQIIANVRLEKPWRCDFARAVAKLPLSGPPQGVHSSVHWCAYVLPRRVKSTLQPPMQARLPPYLQFNAASCCCSCRSCRFPRAKTRCRRKSRCWSLTTVMYWRMTQRMKTCCFPLQCCSILHSV